MNESPPPEINSSSTDPESGIHQKVEKSTLEGGMQASIGNNNNQNQSNQTVNVFQSKTELPQGCTVNLALFGITILTISVTLYYISPKPLNIDLPNTTPTPTISPSPTPIPTFSITPEYETLEFLLLRPSLENLRRADLETRFILLKMSGKGKTDFLTINDLSKIPCQSLNLVDQLWESSSRSRFGFTVQSRIWYSSGRNYINFSNRVGWLRDGAWANTDLPKYISEDRYLKEKFLIDHRSELVLRSIPSGSLPRAVWWEIMNETKGAEAVFQRIKTCKSEPNYKF